MPFPAQTPRPFTREDALTLNQDQMGCYGILVQRLTETWVYIGSGDIRQRLLDHIDDNPCITQNSPTHWVGSVTNDYIEEEKRLIAEYQPICNQRLG